MSGVYVDSLAVGLYGRLAVPGVVGADEHDCFSMFIALGSTLGWLADPQAGAGGLWGMNDAQGPWFGDEPSGLRGLFQVSPLGDGTSPLPVEALCAAGVATLERFGTFTLDGLEMYVPVGTAGPAARHILNGHAWFAAAPPQSRLRITLDSGDSSAAVDLVDDIVAAADAVAPSEEGLAVHRVEGVPVDFSTPVPWRWWLGTPHTATLAATATEWSPLGVGRVVACLVEACRAAGVTDGIGMRVAPDSA